MTKIYKFFGLILMISLILSCSTTNRVSNEGFVQKRKYNPGFHVNIKGDVENIKQAEKKIILSNDYTKTEKYINPTLQIEDGTEIVYSEENFITSVNSEIKDIDVSNSKLKEIKEINISNKREQSEKVKVIDINGHKVKSNTLAEKTTKKDTKKLKRLAFLATKDDLSGMAVAGFVLSLLGLLFFFLPGFGILLGILGLIFSIIGLIQTSNGRSGKGFAIAGLVLGLIIIFFWLLVILAVIAA